MALGPVLAETSLVLDTNILTAWRYRKSRVVAAVEEYQSRLKIFPALTAITVRFTVSKTKRRSLANLMSELNKIDSRLSS